MKAPWSAPGVEFTVTAGLSNTPEGKTRTLLQRRMCVCVYIYTHTHKYTFMLIFFFSNIFKDYYSETRFCLTQQYNMDTFPHG